MLSHRPEVVLYAGYTASCPCLGIDAGRVMFVMKMEDSNRTELTDRKTSEDGRGE
jgi:hypothetical protein